MENEFNINNYPITPNPLGGFYLKNANFTSLTFYGGNLTSPPIRPTYVNTSFNGVTLLNANFTNASLNGLNFTGLNNVNFTNANFTNVNFNGANLFNLNFTETSLNGVNFNANGGNLFNVNFYGAKLFNVNFTNVKNPKALGVALKTASYLINVTINGAPVNTKAPKYPPNLAI
jgi:uncharacterized protein YjbI with pentapeptide repeats